MYPFKLPFSKRILAISEGKTNGSYLCVQTNATLGSYPKTGTCQQEPVRSLDIQMASRQGLDALLCFENELPFLKL